MEMMSIYCNFAFLSFFGALNSLKNENCTIKNLSHEVLFRCKIY